MEEFMSKYPDHIQVKLHLQLQGVTESNFYSFEAFQMHSFLNNYPDVKVYIENFINEKQKVSFNEVDMTGEPDNDCEMLENESSFANVMNKNKRPSSNGLVNEASIAKKHKISQADMKDYYANNDMFTFLMNNVEGRIVLGIYMVSKKVHYNILQRLLAVKEYNENFNSRKYEISSKRFDFYADQLVELFPTVQKSVFFKGGAVNKGTDAAGGLGGNLYQGYKDLRKLLRQAGLVEKNEYADEDGNVFLSPEEVWKRLSNLDQSSYSNRQVICDWELTCEERLKSLVDDTQSKAFSIERYFNGLPSLRSPIGIDLLSIDFKYLIEKSIKQGDLTKAYKEYDDAFITNWPSIAKKIVDNVKEKLAIQTEALKNKTNKKYKGIDVNFLKDNENLFKDDATIPIAALMLLPYCMCVPKQSKSKSKTAEAVNQVENAQVITYSRDDVMKSFILHVKNGGALEYERRKFETFIVEQKLELTPYVILTGPLTAIEKSYVVLNDEVYENTKGTLNAIHDCFKCLKALRRWPYLCDYLWIFIQKKVYKIPSAKTFSKIDQFITELNAFDKKQEELSKSQVMANNNL